MDKRLSPKSSSVRVMGNGHELTVMLTDAAATPAAAAVDDDSEVDVAAAAALMLLMRARA
jgi:hypothetical protein